MSFLNSKISQITLTIEDIIQDRRIENQAYSRVLFWIIIKYHAKEQLIIITLKHVMMNIGYDLPSPCITLLHIIPIVIKGTAKAKILKYPTPISSNDLLRRD